MNIIKGSQEDVYADLDRVIMDHDYPKIPHNCYFVQPNTSKILLALPQSELSEAIDYVQKKYPNKVPQEMPNDDNKFCIRAKNHELPLALTRFVDDLKDDNLDEKYNLERNLLGLHFYDLKHKFNKRELMFTSIEGLFSANLQCLSGDGPLLNFYCIIWDRDNKLNCQDYVLCPTFEKLFGIKQQRLRANGSRTQFYFKLGDAYSCFYSVPFLRQILQKIKAPIEIQISKSPIHKRCSTCRKDIATTSLHAQCIRCDGDIICNRCMRIKPISKETIIQVPVMSPRSVIVKKERGQFIHLEDGDEWHFIQSLYMLDDKIAKDHFVIADIVELTPDIEYFVNNEQ